MARFKPFSSKIKAELFGATVEGIRTGAMTDEREHLKREAATRGLDPDKVLQAWDQHVVENGPFWGPALAQEIFERKTEEGQQQSHQAAPAAAREGGDEQNGSYMTPQDATETIIDGIDQEFVQVAGPHLRGQEFRGTVVRIQSYGAFVRLHGVVRNGQPAQGLLHISQIASEGEFVELVSDYLTEGQSVTVRVLDVEPHSQKGWLIRLSSREAGEPLQLRQATATAPKDGGPATTTEGSAPQARHGGPVRFDPASYGVELLRMLEDLQATYDGAPARLHAYRDQFKQGLTLCRTAVQAVGGGN